MLLLFDCYSYAEIPKLIKLLKILQ